MAQVITIALDLAKSVFKVHSVDAAGEVVVRRPVKRSQLLQFFARQPACLVGTKACAASHYRVRELVALGYAVKRMTADTPLRFCPCNANISTQRQGGRRSR